MLIAHEHASCAVALAHCVHRPLPFTTASLRPQEYVSVTTHVSANPCRRSISTRRRRQRSSRRCVNEQSVCGFIYRGRRLVTHTSFDTHGTTARACAHCCRCPAPVPRSPHCFDTDKMVCIDHFKLAPAAPKAAVLMVCCGKRPVSLHWVHCGRPRRRRRSVASFEQTLVRV